MGVSVALPSGAETVAARVGPPAPEVTDTNDGCSRSSSRSAVHSCRSASGVRGGKNSNDHVGRPPASSSRTVGVTTAQGTGDARGGIPPGACIRISPDTGRTPEAPEQGTGGDADDGERERAGGPGVGTAPRPTGRY